MKLKIAYFGTPDFAAGLLEKILLDKDLPVEVALVVTQPDKPVGRKKIMTPSPVKLMAKKYTISLYEHQTEQESLEYKLQNIDLVLLYAYGSIIKKDLLKAPKHGFWNIHPSLLPKYRGASPISYPLLLGETETGVTLMQMDSELDHGPIIAQQKYQFLPNDKRSDLEIKLTDVGFEMFKKSIPLIAITTSVISNLYSSGVRDLSSSLINEISLRQEADRNDIQTIEQDHSQTPFTRRLTKDDGLIPLSVIKKALKNEPLSFDELPTLIKEYSTTPHVIPSEGSLPAGRQVAKRTATQIIYDYFRGLHPWPGIWTKIMIDGVEKRLKITNMVLVEDKLDIKMVQLEGKQEISFTQFKKAFNIF